MANALTGVRLLLVAPFAFFMARGDKQSALFALLVWCVALLTDFLDGALARRRGIASAFGETFDHTSDFLFVTSGMFAGAYRGAFPWILPVLIVAAFSQYAIGSYRMNGRARSCVGTSWAAITECSTLRRRAWKRWRDWARASCVRCSPMLVVAAGSEHDRVYGPAADARAVS